VNRLFDPEVIQAQIANLMSERDRIDSAVRALQVALKRIQEARLPQSQLLPDPNTQSMTLQDRVRQACLEMIDGITRQRVIRAIRPKQKLELNPAASQPALRHQ